MKLYNRIFFLAALLTLAGCSPLLRGGSNARYRDLSRAADKYLSGPSLRGSSWSIMAVDLKDGAILLARDQDRSLAPASNIKLLVTACALETLGPQYRLATTIGYTGSIDAAGTLNGDLIVIGAGDPSMSSRFADSSDTFSAWADSLSKHGIRRIKGNIIGYIGLFKGDPLGSGWEWNDLPDWFASEFSPLVYSDNCVEVTVIPGDTVGQAATISFAPEGDFPEVSGMISTVSADGSTDINYNRELASNNILLWGSIAQGAAPERRWVTVHQPADFFLRHLAHRLQRKGIQISGQTQVSSSWQPSYADFKFLFVDLSPPLINLINIINQHSSNLYAELLIRILGIQAQAADMWGLQAQDPLQAGRDKIKEWESHLVGFSTGYSQVDGSGLSRRNLACASEFIKILVNMNRSPHRGEFWGSLATPEVGTLRGRLLGLPQGIGVQAKTGTLARAKALSGYLTESGQPRLAFSFICNNYLCADEEAERTIDTICQLLALYIKAE